ncbi:MAG TPA: Calx-beta domain-containing protein, partial [Thermoanaerobaculia bacterium]
MRRLVLLLLLCAGSIAANAATFTVNNTGDAADAAAGNGTCATSGGVCTLRAALNEANALAGTDTINFGIAGAGPHTIAPASPLPVASSLIIDGTTQLGIGAGPFILLDGTNTVTAGLDFATMSGLNVTIQGLAIGRFTLAGIRTYQISSAVTVKRCHIGVGTDGVTDMGNGDGIWAQIRDLGGSSLIVGDATGGGNVISGNADMGIEIDDSPTGSKLSTFTLQGNIIGLASDGMTQVANSSGAIRTDLQLGNVTIGGSVAGRNIISGNGGGGFLTSGFLQTDLLTFSDNYVGVAIDGNTPRGNNGNGATLVAKQYVVENNIVAANTGHGLTFATSTLSSPIRGNRIGVTADGSAAGNGGSGIVWSSQNAGVIGGPATADQNIIAYNGASGVRVQGGQTEIAENAIFLNGTLGIDLGTINVVDANDVNDADTGGNGLQNRPVISSAMRSGGVTFISGSLSSTPSTAYVIRIFSNTAADPSGFGEGETFVTSVNVTTNAGGTAAFNITTAGAPAGTYVSATATSAGGDTSEFSNAQLVGTPPQMRFASASYVTSELGSVTLTIVRVGGTGVAASVNWATSAGSATAADFAAASGVVNFSPSDTTRTITIAIAPDVLDEIDETFTVTLATPTNADLGAPSVATVQITDDDLAPSVSIGDASINEGNAGSTSLPFNVTLSAASGKPITVDYVTSNGTATAASDYAAIAGTLTFAPGQTVKSIVAQLVGDTSIETNETFTITLSNPVEVTIGDGSATGTIVNDDGLPAITIGDVAIVEGDAGTSTALFTVTLSGPTTATVTANWSTASGTATAGVDYEAASGIVTFAPGELTKSIAVTINGDALVEDNETFTVDLASPANATLADAQGGGTIADDDGTPSLSINDPAVVEGVGATFTVTLAPASALPVTVNYATSNLTATATNDYTTAANTLTFAAGETTKLITVATSDDAVAEPTEDFAITLSGAAGATLGDAGGIATIIDNDGAPRITIGNVTAAETNSGTVAFTFDVDLSHASASTVTVDYSTADGTATAGSGDYATGSGTLTFAPAVTSQSITVMVSGDAIIEPDETLVVTLGNASNAIVIDAEGVATIANDDGAASVSIANATIDEGTGGALDIEFEVTLNAASALPVTVQWATADGTANASDYTAGAGTITFAPGEVLQTIAIAVNTDTAFEPNESFVVNLLGATNASISDAQGTGTLINDDAAPAVPVISIGNASLAESNAGTTLMTFAVQLDVATINTVSVDYATGDGAATAGTDYVATNGTLTFSPGVTTLNVTVPVIGDTLVESNETFAVTLTSPSNATLGIASGTGTILEDDVAPVVPTISIAPASLAEGNAGSTSMTFAVQLNVPTVATVTVNYATSNGTAIAGNDYANTSGTLTFAPGVTTQNISVPIIGDTLVESNESFAVTLTLPSNATLGTASANGTILDDDVAPVVPSISIAPASLAEGNAGSTSMTFAVQLNVPTVATVTVNYATSDGTAVAGNDYANTSGTLTFAPGVTTQTISVPIIGDTLVESNESF